MISVLETILIIIKRFLEYLLSLLVKQEVWWSFTTFRTIIAGNWNSTLTLAVTAKQTVKRVIFRNYQDKIFHIALCRSFGRWTINIWLCDMDQL